MNWQDMDFRPRDSNIDMAAITAILLIGWMGVCFAGAVYQAIKQAVGG